jgi:fimbrial chaperone protein
MNANRRIASALALTAILFVLLKGMAGEAQSLSVLPVNIHLAPNEKATSLTVTNQGTAKTAIQIRAYAWNQEKGEDILTASDDVVASPPIVSIAPGASQVIRLVLRQSPQGREATYRILLDQIPPPAEPGIVHVVLRLSIPIFAQPTTVAAPHVQFHLETNDGQIYLVGINNGLGHEAIREFDLTTSDGRKLKPAAGSSPYILAGATRRWTITAQGPLPTPSETLQMTGHSDAGAIEEQVRVASTQ